MVRELLFKTTASKFLGIDKRTLAKYLTVVPPVGIIQIGRRKFPVYDREEIESIREVAVRTHQN